MNILLPYDSFLFESKKVKFTIPEEIKQLYNIKGDMSNVRNWTGTPLEPQVLKDDYFKKYGHKIRYIMISLESNNIVPITINDEHHVGYDVLHDKIYNKYKVKRENYISMCSYGTHYVYSLDKKEAKDQTELFKKYIQYGGDKNMLVQVNGRKDYKLTVNEFVKCNGNMEKHIEIMRGENKISFLGRKLIELLETLTLSLKKYEYSEIKKAIELKQVFKDYENLSDFIVWHHEEFCKELYTKFYKNLNESVEKEDYEKCHRYVFSHSGLKNYIHIKLKEYVNGTNKDENLSEFFIDVEQALKEFEVLSNI
jgi:hypothetical protein